MLVSVQEASNWASEYIGRTVTPTNITYLVQYGKIHKFPDESRKVRVNKEELQEYYDKYVIRKQDSWKNKLGKELTVEEVLLTMRNLKCKVYENELLVMEPTKQQKLFAEKLNIILPKNLGI